MWQVLKFTLMRFIGRRYITFFFSPEKHEIGEHFPLVWSFESMLHTKTIMSWQELEHYVTFGQAIEFETR